MTVLIDLITEENYFKDTELPAEQTASQIIVALTDSFGKSGLGYSLYWENGKRKLLDDETLAHAGIANGDSLRLQPPPAPQPPPPPPQPPPPPRPAPSRLTWILPVLAVVLFSLLLLLTKGAFTRFSSVPVSSASVVSDESPFTSDSEPDVFSTAIETTGFDTVQSTPSKEEPSSRLVGLPRPPLQKKNNPNVETQPPRPESGDQPVGVKSEPVVPEKPVPRYTLRVFAGNGEVQTGQQFRLGSQQLNKLRFVVDYSEPPPFPDHSIRVEWRFNGDVVYPFNFDPGNNEWVNGRPYDQKISGKGKFEVILIVDGNKSDSLMFYVI